MLHLLARLEARVARFFRTLALGALAPKGRTIQASAESFFVL